MIQRLILTAGVILGVMGPSVALAAVGDESTLFDLFYDEVRQALPNTKPPERIAKFVVEEMRFWGDRGIQLTVDDIDLAIAGTLVIADGDGLCENQTDVSGKPYEFTPGGVSIPGSCLALQSDILALLTAEEDAEQLGADLMTLANSSELAVADEPHRPLNMGKYAMLIKHVWSGTGSAIIPWEGKADSEFVALDSSLKALSPADLDKAVLRFHYGYFRDKREADPRFSGIVDSIGADLKQIADKLNITGESNASSVFTTPKLAARNVALWARKDDIGLLWIYPTHAFRLNLSAANRYPEFSANGDNLAYPFEYAGAVPPSGQGIMSPLCSGLIGRQGYLCRPQQGTVKNCENTGAVASITLVKCSEKITETSSGPAICPGFEKLFSDTGVPLEDPGSPGQLNPALKQADIATICSPGKKVLYQDDITSNACYIGLCLLQSMSGHTLVPNRSPVVMNEAASPYLACIRPDPELGLYTEIAEDSPYPLPEYLVQFLVRDFERQYCSKNGDAPQALLGLCVYNDNEDAALPIQNPLTNAQTTASLHQLLTERGNDFNSIAASIGLRASLDQSIELERKMFGKLAHFVQHIANLLLELKRAPLTQSACPWTGAFPSSPSE